MYKSLDNLSKASKSSKVKIGKSKAKASFRRAHRRKMDTPDPALDSVPPEPSVDPPAAEALLAADDPAPADGAAEPCLLFRERVSGGLKVRDSIKSFVNRNVTHDCAYVQVWRIEVTCA